MTNRIRTISYVKMNSYYEKMEQKDHLEFILKLFKII